MPALFRVFTLVGYLGWIAIAIGLIVFLFRDSSRGTELMVGGMGAIVLKYVGTLVLVLLARRSR